MVITRWSFMSPSRLTTRRCGSLPHRDAWAEWVERLARVRKRGFYSPTAHRPKTAPLPAHFASATQIILLGTRLILYKLLYIASPGDAATCGRYELKAKSQGVEPAFPTASSKPGRDAPDREIHPTDTVLMITTSNSTGTGLIGRKSPLGPGRQLSRPGDQAARDHPAPAK